MGRRDLQSPLLLFFLVGSMVSSCTTTRPSRTKWLNPCHSYVQKPNRPTREARALDNEINIAINEFIEINRTITNMYDSPSTRFPIKNKFNASSSLLHFYRDFYAFGRKLENALAARIDTEDNVFQQNSRCTILHQISNRTRSVMCEMYDVLNRKHRFNKKFIRKTSVNIKEPTILQNMTLTKSMAVDIVLYDTYIKLLRTLRKTVRRSRKNRSNHLSVRKSKNRNRKNKKHKNKLPKKA